jgi:sirohydrochlorin cobaltochelatase
VEHGYLEFANPVIGTALDRLRERGVERVLAVPGMLFAATHAKNDIPSVLNAYAARHGIEVRMGRELGVDPRLIAAAADRVREAMAEADARSGVAAPEETCLVVIGRGASDPDANGQVARAARMLWEGMGFGWCLTGYSGVTFPLVEPTLEHAARLGYRRVVVLPWFLFSGILVDRIRGFTGRVAGRTPEVGFVDAGYLGTHEQVVDLFAERATEQVGEVPPPNCAMCKYRTAVLGFEGEVGAPQHSHHHHVEGQGAQAPGSNVAACRLCQDFCTGECRLVAEAQGGGHDHAHGHGHGHHHAPHPHADHPHGPRSVLRSRP